MTLGAAVLLALSAVQAAAPERIVRNGEAIPDDVRPCIDYVGRGSLTFGGNSPVDDPDDLIGHSIYRWRYRETEPVVGRWAWHDRVLRREGHALHTGNHSDVAVFVARNEDGQARWIGWEQVWQDSHGRDFLPILRWPNPKARGLEWMPDAARRFASRVSYIGAQPGLPLGPDDDKAGLVETRQGVTRVLYRLYLSDLPAMFAAARAEPCWR